MIPVVIPYGFSINFIRFVDAPSSVVESLYVFLARNKRYVSTEELRLFLSILVMIRYVLTFIHGCFLKAEQSFVLILHENIVLCLAGASLG